MDRITYLNGTYLRHSEARIHVDDRGFLMGDGVYDATGILEGHILDLETHLKRLERSLAAIRMPMPLPAEEIEAVVREVVRRNAIENGVVYIHVTRGVAPRDHGFPHPYTPQTLMVTTWPCEISPEHKAKNGLKVITMPDIRWGRCDIKATTILANVLARQAALDAGADEAWLVDSKGLVTEGAATNAWIVDAQGNLMTRHLDNSILPGITRATLARFADLEGYAVVERAFSVEEAKEAREAFVTGSASFVLPVVAIDDVPVGDGRPGPIVAALRKLYFSVARSL